MNWKSVLAITLMGLILGGIAGYFISTGVVGGAIIGGLSYFIIGLEVS